MKYFFRILLIAVFFISESIEEPEKFTRRRHIEEVLELQTRTKESIETLNKMEQNPTECVELLENFAKTFERFIEQIDYCERHPRTFQEMMIRYKNIIADIPKSIALHLDGDHYGSNHTQLSQQLRNVVRRSIEELDKIELYSGNIEEIKQYLKKNLLYVNKNDRMKPLSHYIHMCTWHYRKMKYNDNVKCDIKPMLHIVLVHLPTNDGLPDNKAIRGPVPRCDCRELNNEQQPENIFIIEEDMRSREFVCTVMKVEKSKYILELQSGWQKINEKLLYHNELEDFTL